MAVDDTYTKVLLHMNGTDASTTFIDESGKTWTRSTNAQIDTAQYKFGGASGLFDGGTDYIDTPDHADFYFASGDFTIDLWLKRNTSGVIEKFMGQSDSAETVSLSSFRLRFSSANNLNPVFYGGSTSYSISGVVTIVDTNWHHLAYVRYGNTITQYIDGTADGTVDVTGVTLNDSAYKLAIGRNGEKTANEFNGWIDEVRISKGIARWTSDFTPLTFEYGTPSAFINFAKDFL